MKELKWTSSDILPEKGVELACIITRTDGTIKYTNFEDGPYWYDGKKFCGRNEWGDKTTHIVSYWMPWDDLFDFLENLPRQKRP
jgi:hypothetical protein